MTNAITQIKIFSGVKKDTDLIRLTRDTESK